MLEILTTWWAEAGRSKFKPSMGYIMKFYLKIKIRKGWGWIDDSAVKSSNCSYRGLRFESQYPNGG